MFDRNYYGHDTQFFGVEEHRLVGGRGDGMRLFQVRNGSGVEFTVSVDRCADISRLSYKGVNMNYMGVGGYAAPAYYDDKGDHFLKTFNCGFLTTCGLLNIGIPQKDGEEELPLHGTIGHQPADRIWYTCDEEQRSMPISRICISSGRSWSWSAPSAARSAELPLRFMTRSAISGPTGNLC